MTRYTCVSNALLATTENEKEMRVTFSQPRFTATGKRFASTLVKTCCVLAFATLFYFLLNVVLNYGHRPKVSSSRFLVLALEKRNTVTESSVAVQQHRNEIANNSSSKPGMRLPKVFITVKTGSHHGASRLAFIIDTWLRDLYKQSLLPEPLVAPLHFISDTQIADYPKALQKLNDDKTNKTCDQGSKLANDSWLADMFPPYDFEKALRFVRSPCADSHEQAALCCKTQYEFRTYYEFSTSKAAPMDWYCHFDDDDYVNIHALSAALARHSQRPQTQLLYIGKFSTTQVYKIPSFIRNDGARRTPRQIDARRLFGSRRRSVFRKPSLPLPVQPPEIIATRFGTGGAGYCLTNGLMRVAKPYLWDFAKYCGQSGVADDVALAYVIATVTKYKAPPQLGPIEEPNLHSHLEPLSQLNETTIRNAISLSFLLARASEKLTQGLRDYYAKRIVDVSFMGTRAAHKCHDPTRFHSLYRLYHSNLDALSLNHTN